MLEARGVAPTLVTLEEARAARTTPPENSPAAIRGRIIRELGWGENACISWDHVRVGGIGGRVIPLRPRSSAPRSR